MWLGTFLLVALPTVAAGCGSLLVRRWIGFERLRNNNEVAGFKFATVGVIYAVLLAFAVIIAWERFSDAESAVVHEAGSAATLYRLAAGPDPEASETRAALANYLRLAIAQDWPRMAAEQESREVTAALNALYTSAMRLAQSGARPAAVVVQVFNQLDGITQARRNRLQLALGIVPTMVWEVLIVGAILTVGFTFFFGTRNAGAQVLMTGILAIIVFMGLYVIVSLDHPFTGPVHVESEPLQAVLADLGR
jgi:hypothetical protein